MRVAVIGTRGYPSYYGGFETCVRNLVPYLADCGWDARVYSRPGASRPDDPDRDARVKVIETPGIESKSLSTLSYGFTSTLHACFHRPDVALVMNVANGFFLPLLWLARVPTVVNVDGIEWERAKWNGLGKAVFRLGAWFTAKLASNLIVDAKAIGQYWEAHFARNGVFIPYGAKFYDTTLPLEPGLTHRGYVLVVARFVPENTIPEFLGAAAEIAKCAPVIIVGSSGHGGELDKAAASLDETVPNVHWLGHVSDDLRLHSLWQHAGVYFHGHSVGGTNPALVQAMALGAPTLARDTNYNREVLAGTGVFTEPDPASIAAATIALLQDSKLQEDLSTQATARARAEYTWDLVNQRYEALLRAPQRRAS
ncbi:MAG: glycosyltransferase [Propionibacteriaceae bacterium]|nr:glycosyltransferase [Propionibacteriaceae bacterium]